ncbi:MAG: YqjF family protein [Nitriliruptoraceae bacterium]
MRWRDVSYLHWDVEPDNVAGRLPEGLEPDLLAGRAYVGLVPFVMDGIRIGAGGPRLPASRFPETNVRTYVVGPDGGRGVYFHSLDIDRLAPAFVARTTYRLPYCYSEMSVTANDHQIAYAARRRWPGPRGAISRVTLEVGERLAGPERSVLDEFVSARFALYESTPRGGLLRADISHEPWPLRKAGLVSLDDELVAAAGYRLDGRAPSHVVHGGCVDVQVSRPRRLT